jgi:electron transport complex protein RnfE
MDGLGIGLGFTLALTLKGAIREFIGAGAIFGFSLRALSQAELPMTIFILPAGGFMVFGLLIVIFNVTVDKVSEYSERKKSQQGAKLNTKNETEEEEIAL